MTGEKNCLFAAMSVQRDRLYDKIYNNNASVRHTTENIVTYS
jgi:hypothetical protein